MSAKTILSLCNGEYSFVDRSTSKDSRYSENLSKCVSIEDALKNLVNEEIFSLIEQLLDHQNLMSSFEIEDAFVEGFSLAVSLLLESISVKK